MYNTCKHCGAITENKELCLFCKSKLTHCKSGNFYQKKLSLYVPWCREKDRPILVGKGKWLCDSCKNSLKAGRDNAK